MIDRTYKGMHAHLDTHTPRTKWQASIRTLKIIAHFPKPLLCLDRSVLVRSCFLPDGSLVAGFLTFSSTHDSPAEAVDNINKQQLYAVMNILQNVCTCSLSFAFEEVKVALLDYNLPRQ